MTRQAPAPCYQPSGVGIKASSDSCMDKNFPRLSCFLPLWPFSAEPCALNFWRQSSWKKSSLHALLCVSASVCPLGLSDQVFVVFADLGGSDSWEHLRRRGKRKP